MIQIIVFIGSLRGRSLNKVECFGVFKSQIWYFQNKTLISSPFLFFNAALFTSLTRFTAVPAHPDRWDMLLYTGGPVWAMEWCPTPDGAPASQYVALACHQGMEDQHCVNKTHSGVGLVQLWGLGALEYNSR